MECKHEQEMLQVELYVSDVEQVSRLFTSVFDLIVIESKAGWRHLRHRANYDIMLFAPATNVDGESHWPLPDVGTGGAGIELVICTTDAAGKRIAIRGLGYECTELQYPPGVRSNSCFV
jgi:hypothetical protein